MLIALGAAECAHVASGQRVGTAAVSGKALALLVYLSAVGTRVSREHLADLLWADLEPDGARHALRQTLWFLRKKLGDDISAAAGSDIGLGRPLESDRDHFLSALARQDLEAAVAAYAGDFLPNFAVAGGGAFDQWADLERRQLRTAFLRAADKLARRQLSSGRFSEAVALARRMRDTDRDLESGWRLLIEALLAARDHLSATIEADALERMLHDEGREIEPATRATLRMVRQSPAPANDTDARPALVVDTVGREREFSLLLSAWDAARHRRGRHIHVTALAGIGKSRLLGDVHARILAARGKALLIRANPGERALSYTLAATLATTLAALPGARGISSASAASLLALTPAVSSWINGTADPATGDEALRRRTIAVGELLANVAAEHPVAVLVDDLHWADAASRQLLQGVAARCAGSSALLITASRPVAAAAAGDLPEEILTLVAFHSSDVLELLARVGNLPNEPWAHTLPDDLTRATSGSPLLVLETLHLLLERDALRLNADGWTMGSADRLLDLLGAGSAISRRLEQLSRQEFWLLLLLATSGTPVAVTALAAMSAVSEGEALETLGVLERRGLVAVGGGLWQIAHDEISDRVLAVAPADARRAAHLAIARAHSGMEPATMDALTRAVAHAEAGGDIALAEATFTRAWVRQRASGDPATPLALAARMLGTDHTAARARALADALPWLLRPSVRRMLAAAAAVMVLGAGGAALAVTLKPSERADAFITAWRPVASAGGTECVVARFSVDRGVFAQGMSLRPAVGVQRYATSARGWMSCLPNLDGTGMVYPHDFRDSGGIDLVVRAADGTERRLTNAAGDDDGARWHASGQLLVFQSGRFDPKERRSQLMVMDAGGGTARRLTNSASLDREPTPSPDGARVAFIRQVQTRGLDSLCVINFDATDSRCIGIPSERISYSVSWTSARHVVVAWQADSVSLRQRLDILKGRLEPLPPAGSFAISSPSGQFVAELRDGTALVVYPEGQRPARRPLALPYDGAGGFRWDWPARGTLVDTLRVLLPAADALAGTSLRLGVRATDPFGTALEPVGVRWRVVEGDAVVDSLGMLTPRAAGLVRVSADVGGWRGDTVLLRVAAANETVVLTEDWRAWPAPRWVSFGAPRPSQVMGPGNVPAMSHNGDGNYPSGVYTRDSLSASAGIGMEVLVSAPISEKQWQGLDVQFSPPIAGELARWDHAEGGPPFTWPCAAGLPGGEGLSVMRALSASTPAGGRVVQWDSTAFNGSWHRMRLQLFPDGRCGVAMDGRPAILLSGARAVPPYVRVVVGGKSVRTRILAGPLTVWTGIRTDVDWSALSKGPSAAAKRP